MIGTDIVKIERFEKDYQLFVKRILSKDEQIQISKYSNHRVQLEYLAGRFAGKEAFVKASGLLKANYSDISIVDDLTGKPSISYLGKVVGDISISHDDYAIAIVVLKPDTEA